MGVSTVRIKIDRLVLKGFRPSEGDAVAEALQSQLKDALSPRDSETHWKSRRTPVLRLGRVSLERGAGGVGRLGREVGRKLAGGLKP